MENVQTHESEEFDTLINELKSLNQVISGSNTITQEQNKLYNEVVGFIENESNGFRPEIKTNFLRKVKETIPDIPNHSNKKLFSTAGISFLGLYSVTAGENMLHFLGSSVSYSLFAFVLPIVGNKINNHNEYLENRFSNVERILKKYDKRLNNKNSHKDRLNAYNVKISAILNVKKSIWSDIINMKFLQNGFLKLAKKCLESTQDVTTSVISQKKINKFLRGINYDIQATQADDFKTRKIKENIRENFNLFYDQVSGAGIEEYLKVLIDDKIKLAKKMDSINKRKQETDYPKNLKEHRSIEKQLNRLKEADKKTNSIIDDIAYLELNKKRCSKRLNHYIDSANLAKEILSCDQSIPELLKIKKKSEQDSLMTTSRLSIAQEIIRDGIDYNESLADKIGFDISTLNGKQNFSNLIFLVISSQNKEEAKNNIELLIQDNDKRNIIDEQLIKPFFKEFDKINAKDISYSSLPDFEDRIKSILKKAAPKAPTKKESRTLH